MTVQEELYRPFTTIVNEMLKLRVKVGHCMAIELLMVFITIVNETLKLRAKLEHCMTVHLLIVNGLVTVVLKCFRSVLQVYIYLFFPCLIFFFYIFLLSAATDERNHKKITTEKPIITKG